jgi:hypothetical protein
VRACVRARLRVVLLVLMCRPNSPTPTSGAPQRSLIDRLLYDKFEEELIIQPGRYFPPDVRPSLTALLCAHGSVSHVLTAGLSLTSLSECARSCRSSAAS